MARVERFIKLHIVYVYMWINNQTLELRQHRINRLFMNIAVQYEINSYNVNYKCSIFLIELMNH